MSNDKDQNIGTILKTTESVTNSNMVNVTHPPHLLDITLCDVTVFLKLKMKLKGHRFETMSDFQRESQTVLHSIKENHFHTVFKHGKKIGLLYTFPRRLF